MVLLGTNALAYLLTVLAARLLAPAAFGELSAALSLLLIGTVPAAALQTVTALLLATRPDPRAAAATAHATALVTAAALGALVALAAAPLTALLRLPDGALLGWLALLLAAHTLVGAYDGILQGAIPRGRGRHRRLAAAMVGFGVCKLGGGVLALLVGRTPTAVVGGMAVGAAGGAALGWWICGRPGLRRGVRGQLPATGAAAASLLGFVVLTTMDVLLARYHLDPGAAGEYALGAVITKIAFWLPQGVGVVLLPHLGDGRKRAALLPGALAAVAAAGLLLTAGLALGGPAAVAALAGTGPAGAGPGAAVGRVAWLFALLGTALAVGQLLLLSGLAAGDRATTRSVWAAVGLAVGAVAAAGRLTVVALAVVTTAVVALFVAGGLLRARRWAGPGAASTGPGRRGPGRPTRPRRRDRA